MLRSGLLHPEMLPALAAADHGSQVLISDGNCAHSTVPSPSVPRVYLNLAPGRLTVPDVLEGIRVDHLPRFEFNAAVRSDSLALVIATVDHRTFANVLLTIGVCL